MRKGTGRRTGGGGERGKRYLPVIPIFVVVVMWLGMARSPSESEAKRSLLEKGLHQIQIALERYSVDHSGAYPLFLIGGEPGHNGLSDERTRVYREPVVGGKPFSPFARAAGRADGKYCRQTENGEQCMDPLLFEGYLQRYPANPYAGSVERRLFGASSPLHFAAAGEEGDRMWDLGLGWGDAPVINLELRPSLVGGRSRSVSLAGNFYYHPIFCDGYSVAAHHRFAIAEREERVPPGVTLDVCGYVLVGFASTGGEDGVDFTHRIPKTHQVPWAPRLSVRGFLLTGYFSFEDDPYACTRSQVRELLASARLPGFTICAPMRRDLQTEGSGPDGLPDGDVVILFAGPDGPPMTKIHRRRPPLP